MQSWFAYKIPNKSFNATAGYVVFDLQPYQGIFKNSKFCFLFFFSICFVTVQNRQLTALNLTVTLISLGEEEYMA